MTEKVLELSGDLAASNPDQDALGYSPLARSVAKGIYNMARARSATSFGPQILEIAKTQLSTLFGRIRLKKKIDCGR